MTSKNPKRSSPLLAIALVGAGAYLVLNSQKAQASELPPAGIGSGYGDGATLGTQGASTTDSPVSATPTAYNITFQAPDFGSADYGTQDTSNGSKKDQNAQDTGSGSNVFTSSTRSIKVGNYTGTATKLTEEGNQLLNFGENAQAVTLTKKQIQEQSAQAGAPVVGLIPVGNSASDVIKAGNVASIIAQSVATTNTTTSKKTATINEGTNTGWGNPIGFISSSISKFFGGN